MMESWQDCAKREVEEETGLQVVNVEFVHVTNDPMPAEDKREWTIDIVLHWQRGFFFFRGVGLNYMMLTNTIVRMHVPYTQIMLRYS